MPPQLRDATGSFGEGDSHRVRLRGPWDFEWIKAPATLPEGGRRGRLDLSATWEDAFGSHRGTVRLSRRFGRPAEPDPADRVWLEVSSPAGASVVLNGDWLGTVAPGTARLEVTSRIAFRNRLDLDLTAEEPPPCGASLAEVALIFEGTAR